MSSNNYKNMSLKDAEQIIETNIGLNQCVSEAVKQMRANTCLNLPSPTPEALEDLANKRITVNDVQIGIPLDDLTALADNISSATNEPKQTGGKKYYNKHNGYNKCGQRGGELTPDEILIEQYTSRQRSIATGILLAAGIAAGAWSFGLMQISALGRFASLQQLLVSLRIITEPCVDESAVGRHIFDQAMSYIQTSSDTITCANISMEYENALKRLWTFLTGAVFVGYRTLNWKDSWKRMQLTVLRLLFTKPPTLEELQAQERASDAIDAAAEAAKNEAIARQRESELIELDRKLQHELTIAKKKQEHAKRISQLDTDVILTDAQTSPLPSPTAATTTNIADATQADEELKAAEAAVKESSAKIAAAQKATEDAAEQAAADKVTAQHAAAEYTAITEKTTAENEDDAIQRDAFQFITSAPSSTPSSKASSPSPTGFTFSEELIQPEESEKLEKSKTVTTPTSTRRTRRRRGGKKSHTKKSHTKKSHTKKSHTKKSHTKKSHTKKSHTKKSHIKKSHIKKSHTKKSHIKKSHIKKSHTKKSV